MSYANTADGLIKAAAVANDPIETYRRTVATFDHASLVDQLVAERQQSNKAGERIAHLDRANEEQRRMLREFSLRWSELNTHLNDAADGADLCESYEEALNTWNDKNLGKYHLEGRTVEDSYTATITITTRRPRHANEIDYDIDVAMCDAAYEYLSSEGHTDIEIS